MSGLLKWSVTGTTIMPFLTQSDPSPEEAASYRLRGFRLVVSQDGTRVVVATSTHLFVFDGGLFTNEMLLTWPVPPQQRAAGAGGGGGDEDDAEVSSSALQVGR